MELRLLALRLPFMKITSLGFEKQKALKGNVVNVQHDIAKCAEAIPREFEDTSIVQLKLMRRMTDKQPYMFDTIRPALVMEAAKHLVTTPLYQKYGADVSKIWDERHPGKIPQNRVWDEFFIKIFFNFRDHRSFRSGSGEH